MHRIERSLRLVAVGIVSALIIACGSDGVTAPRPGIKPPPSDSLPTLPPDTTTPAPTPSPIIGTWTSVRINGSALPARIAGDTEPDGLVWEVRVLQDTLYVRGDGRWVQRVRTQQVQSDGFFARGTWGDRGIWTRNGDTIHFESDWIENVAYDAHLAADGTLVVDHNFTLDETLGNMRREMRR